jgi:hypothetical protein
MLKKLPIVFTLTIVGLLAPIGFVAEPIFKAGAAKQDITPKEPVPMWGYGERHALLSKGTLDPLHASAVVIQIGDIKLAIVGLDLGRSPSESSLQRIRARIAEQAGIVHSLIAGSHTHHGPVLELSNAKTRGKGRYDAAIRYYQELEDAIVATIVEADKASVPAKLATGSKPITGFNRNRHTKLRPIPIDGSLAVLRLDNAETGKTIAMIANFAGHPTMLPAETLQFSADYVGAMKQAIEQELGGVAIFMQGAAGDLSVNKGSNSDHVEFGNALGREAIKISGSIPAYHAGKPSLEVREQQFRFEPRVDLKSPLIRIAYSAAFFPELVANFVDEYADGIRPRMTIALLNGDIALVGVSGEFFCQHAIRLRERARMNQLFYFGYCNGYHQYFPTIEAAAEGGYGADSQVAIASVGAGEQLMNNALIWLLQMQGKLK